MGTRGKDTWWGYDAPLYAMPEGIETRWASPENPEGAKGKGGRNGTRKGRPCVVLKAGEQMVLAESAGSPGIVRRIWMTINDRSPAMLRGLRLDFYWDDAEKPAVSAPLGDFFGHALGRMTRFSSSLFSSPEGRSFNCAVPMPFKDSMRLTITNETDTPLDWLFYDVDYTLGDKTDDALYLHAYFNREQPTALRQDYEFLPLVSGKGRYLGVNTGVIVDTERYLSSWWGEGECKMYLDGDRDLPTLCGTGTEDYIGTGWGLGLFEHPYQGCHLADADRGHYGFYRYHVPDPVYFSQDIRVAMQQIGCANEEEWKKMTDAGNPPERTGFLLPDGMPSCLFERQDDWSSCAYFYLDRPESDLAPLLPLEERLSGLSDLPK